ncbi:MAG: SHOCT domain-containing protein, partial [Planctomycetes bacterium]|nr:SHOCT domain-containing protein [Planctomycetota bacterium]
PPSGAATPPPPRGDEAPPEDEAERAAWVRTRLERLRTWHAEGLLDDAEYAAEKQRLLERW